MEIWLSLLFFLTQQLPASSSCRRVMWPSTLKLPPRCHHSSFGLWIRVSRSCARCQLLQLPPIKIKVLHTVLSTALMLEAVMGSNQGAREGELQGCCTHNNTHTNTRLPLGGLFSFQAALYLTFYMMAALLVRRERPSAIVVWPSRSILLSSNESRKKGVSWKHV